MKKIFLIWDIWTWEQWFYHVWDELMFFYNYKVLENYWYEIFTSSRSKESKYNNTTLDINFNCFFRIIKLGVIILFHKIFIKSSAIKKIIEIIKNVDCVIFSWWWNLNSIRKWHLYYRFLITYFAKKFKKGVYLSSQTIWPIHWKLDYLILDYILNYCEIISVRDFDYSKRYINDKFKYKVKIFQDDALIRLNYLKNNKYKKHNNIFTVWLSVHKGENDALLLKQLSKIQRILKSLYWTVKFYKIPHMFDNNWWYDENFMKSINFINYENEFIPELYKSQIEEFYINMDLIVTTRYHWGVLAIKYKKPVIMIWRNEYELWKFNWLIDTLNVKNYILLSNTNKILDEKYVKSVINKSCSIKYDINRFFIYNYVKYYDKDKINKVDKIKK